MTSRAISGVVLLAALVASCTPGSTGDTARNDRSARGDTDTAGAYASDVATIPTANINIGGFVEIDDIDLLGPGGRDANLCSAASQGQGLAACPESLFSSPGFSADNPNYPGPDPTAPAVLGDEADYVDWADLPYAAHFVPFLDNDMLGLPDDIFQPGSCYLLGGNSPSKANLTVNGFAGNDTYLYLYSERERSEGQEEHHYFFTQSPPVLGTDASCPEETWLWTLEDGDIEVTLRFQSTAGLPVASVLLRRWNGGDVSGVLAQELVTSTTWTTVDPAGVAYVALNVNGDDHKAEPDEDLEYAFDGTVLDSGLIAEIAIDIEAVFGEGCGLTRTVAIISTASGSGGRNDDLKDISGPYTVETGVLEPTLELFESCDEEFSYHFEIDRMLSDGSIQAIPLPDPDLDFTLTYDCGDGPVVIDDPALPDGTIAVPVDATAVCEVNISYTGSDEYFGCDGEVSAPVTVYPLLEAQGELDESCDGTYSWSADIFGGSGSPSVLWAFDITNNGAGSEATSEEEDGTAVLAEGIVGASTVDAALQVTDGVVRETALGPETCTATPIVQGVLAQRPLFPDLDLYESCDEEFSYETGVDLTGTGATAADLDIDLTYNCGAGPVLVSDPDLPEGTFPVPVDAPTSCALTMTFAGSGPIAECAGSANAQADVYPVLEAEGALDESCDGTYSWDATIAGGSGGHSVLWAFDITNNGAGSEATSTEEDGTAVLAEGITGASSIAAELMVTDDIQRLAKEGLITCQVEPDVAGVVAQRPLVPELTLYGSCDEEFHYDAVIDLTGTGAGAGDLDVDFSYDCGEGPIAVADPTLPAGTFAVPTETTRTCALSLTFQGSGPIAECDGQASDSVDVHPILEAEGSLDETCDASYSWDTEVSGGSGSYALLWTFDVTDGGTTTQSTSEDDSGTTILPAGTGAAIVEATLVVVDDAVRVTPQGPEICQVTPDVDGVIAERPIQPALTLFESCAEEFSYNAVIDLEGSYATEDDIDVELIYNCGDGPVVIDEPVLPDGTFAVPVEEIASCYVLVSYVGSGVLEDCSGADSGYVAVYPLLTAEGELDQDCDATYSWDATVGGGSGDLYLLWTFDVTDDGVTTQSTSTAEDGSAGLAGGLVSAAHVAASLLVSDNVSRNTVFGEQTCQVTPGVDSLFALRPLQVELAPTTGDATCPADVHQAFFDAIVQGGSGEYTLSWTEIGDANLVSSCVGTTDVSDADQDYLLGCDFNIGDAYCADGAVTLLATDDDPKCEPASDDIAATRIASIDVTPDP